MDAVLALACLAAARAMVMARPRRTPDMAVAMPAALLFVITEIAPAHAVGSQLADLTPTLGFLAAALGIGDPCAAGGLFAGHDFVG